MSNDTSRNSSLLSDDGVRQSVERLFSFAPHVQIKILTRDMEGRVRYVPISEFHPNVYRPNVYRVMNWYKIEQSRLEGDWVLEKHGQNQISTTTELIAN